MLKPKVLIILGQTGAGKTALSLSLAKQFDGEVISADSRQVYRGLDIGTEKITQGEMGGIVHHEIDVVDIDTVYTAMDFTRNADAAINDINNRHKLPIIAGGTYFYIETLLGRVGAPEVPPDMELRLKLEAMSLPELQATLESLDPDRAKEIDIQNPRRVMRAIEIASVLGSVPKAVPTECPYDVLLLGIEVDKEVLRARLKSRAINALERGLIEETTSLLTSGVSRERLNEIGHQYPLVITHLDGLMSREELIQRLEEKNWQYAKRQMTWLKRNESIIWVDTSDTESINDKVSIWLNN